MVMHRGLFITGTDTGVGKTFVTSAIARRLVRDGLTVGVYKPAASGAEWDAGGRPVWGDVEALCEAVGGRFPRERVCPQRFLAPLAPPVAAAAEGRVVDADLLRDGAAWWRDRCDVLLVEGVGGLLCPLTDDETVADLAAELRYPLVVVARLGLGTINHTLLTLEVARHRGLSVAGVLLNEPVPCSADESADTNAAQIAAHTDVPVLGIVRHCAGVRAGSQGARVLEIDSDDAIDWQRLAARL
jgi:dethiobiotin synthetase